MTYNVVFSKTAENHIKKLNKNIQERIIIALERAKTRPYNFVTKLSGYPYYKMRIGDYRIIIDIQKDRIIILVVEIGHRKNIYRQINS